MDELSYPQAVTLAMAFGLAMAINLIRLVLNFSSLSSYRRRPIRSYPQQWRQTHRHAFCVLAIIETVAVTGAQAAFGVLSLTKGQYWLVYLSSSIILASFMREVSGLLLLNRALLILASVFSGVEFGAQGKRASDLLDCSPSCNNAARSSFSARSSRYEETG